MVAKVSTAPADDQGMSDFDAGDDETSIRGKMLLLPRAEEPGFVTPLVMEREPELLPLVPQCERRDGDYLRKGMVIG